MVDETSEEAYRSKLEEVRDTVKAAKMLMRSEEEHVRLQAIDLFIQLSELELALIEALKETTNTTRDDRNPLARKARLDA